MFSDKIKMANGPMVRMNELDKVEKEVVNCLGSAGKALEEIGKDKPSQKQVDNLVSQFMTSLQVKTFIKDTKILKTLVDPGLVLMNLNLVYLYKNWNHNYFKG